MATLRRPPIRDKRHVTVARTLHARLYINCEGRIFAVAGTPVHGPLVQTLKHIARVPTAAEAPTPTELGIDCCDGELTADILFSIGRALHRWGLDLEEEMRRKPAKRRKREAVERDRREVELLTCRLALLRRRQKDPASGLAPAGAPYFLDEPAEPALQSLFDDACRTRPLSPMVLWQARLVFWLSGLCAAKRFLAAYEVAVAEYPAAVRRDPLIAFRRVAKSWVKRCDSATWRLLLSEIIERIRRLPPEAAQSAAITHRRQGGNVRAICEKIVERCTQYLADEELRLTTKLPAELAALTAADGCQVAIPRFCFRHDKHHDFFASAFKQLGQLAGLIGRRGYDRLLNVLARESHPLTIHSFGSFCDLIDRGDGVEDALWSCEHGLQHYIHASALSVRDYRKLTEDFERRGCQFDQYEFRDIVSRVLRPEQLDPVHTWLAWLSSVSPRAMTAEVRKRHMSTLVESYLPTAQRPERFKRMVAAIVPAARRAHARDYEPLLERIAEYRSRSGLAVKLPKSLRKMLEAGETRRREQAHLAEREALGTLDDGAKARLDYLRRTDFRPQRNDKILREAEKMFLQLGFDAVNGIVRTLAFEDCQAELPDLPGRLSTRRVGEFAGWIGQMDESERKMLREIKDARRRHGRAYKRKLGDNREWIVQAAASGVNLDMWFEAPTEHVTVVGRSLKWTITPDLYDLFQMGSYFSTCLSLGGINQMSVLTNAYDANKQVLYLYEVDAHGRCTVVGRQIIAVTPDFKLVGYNWYFDRRLIDDDYAEACRALATQTGRFAARCGFALADAGAPSEIAAHFWYDDGPTPWPDSAAAAWTLERCRANCLAETLVEV